MESQKIYNPKEGRWRHEREKRTWGEIKNQQNMIYLNVTV